MLLSGYEDSILVFALVRTSFLSLYKMVESENSPGNYQTLIITIGTIMINPEMLNFVPDHLKT